MASAQQQLTVKYAIPTTFFELYKRLQQTKTISSDCLDALLYSLFDVLAANLDKIRSLTARKILASILWPSGFALLQESAGVLELVARLTFCCIYERKSPLKQMQILARNEVFIQHCEEYLPHATQWYKAATRSYGQLSNGLSSSREALAKSPSIMSKTPAEAARIHKAEVAQGRWKQLPAEGKVRIHFYKDFQDTRHFRQENGRDKPDARFDLDFDPRSGVDLKAARKMIGAESLAIITDISPYRRVFDPASQDQLSPLAAYDLSKHFREPIRVFEPNASPYTQTKRRLQEPVYLILYFAFVLIKSILGFPLTNRAYVSATFGEALSYRCTHLSKVVRPLNKWAGEGVWLFLQLIGCLLLLPFAFLYQSVKAVNLVGALIAKNGASILCGVLAFVIGAVLRTLSTATRCITTYASSISGRGWIAVLALSWFMIAEFKASVF